MEDPPPYEEVSHCRVCNCTFTTFKRRVRFLSASSFASSVLWAELSAWFSDRLRLLREEFMCGWGNKRFLHSPNISLTTLGMDSDWLWFFCYAASLSCLWEEPLQRAFLESEGRSTDRGVTRVGCDYVIGRLYLTHLEWFIVYVWNLRLFPNLEFTPLYEFVMTASSLPSMWAQLLSVVWSIYGDEMSSCQLNFILHCGYLF